MAQAKKRLPLKSFLKAQAENRLDYVNGIYTNEKGKQFNIDDIEFTFHNFVQTDEISKLQEKVESLEKEIETLKAE